MKLTNNKRKGEYMEKGERERCVCGVMRAESGGNGGEGVRYRDPLESEACLNRLPLPKVGGGVSGVAMTITLHRITRKLAHAPSPPLHAPHPSSELCQFARYECDDKRARPRVFLFFDSRFFPLHSSFLLHVFVE